MATRGKQYTSLHLISGNRDEIMYEARERQTFELSRFKEVYWEFYRSHVEESKSELLPMLLAAGAYLNAQTIEGETPLMTAVLYKYPMMFHLLIKEGASVDCQFKHKVAPLYCRTVFELALAVNFPEAVRILFDAGAKDTVLDHLENATDINETLQEEDCEELKQLIEQLKTERPRRLKILCRKTIRTALGPRIQGDVDKTGLPPALIDYVLMKADLKEAQDFIYDGMTYKEYYGIESDDEDEDESSSNS